jgi:hypothetical protein
VVNDNGGQPEADLLVAELGLSVAFYASRGRPVRDVVGEVAAAHAAASKAFEDMTTAWGDWTT